MMTLNGESFTADLARHVVSIDRGPGPPCGQHDPGDAQASRGPGDGPGPLPGLPPPAHPGRHPGDDGSRPAPSGIADPSRPPGGAHETGPRPTGRRRSPRPGSGPGDQAASRPEAPRIGSGLILPDDRAASGRARPACRLIAASRGTPGSTRGSSPAGPHRHWAGPHRRSNPDLPPSSP
jgi:hypothetical protein